MDKYIKQSRKEEVTFLNEELSVLSFLFGTFGITTCFPFLGVVLGGSNFLVCLLWRWLLLLLLFLLIFSRRSLFVSGLVLGFGRILCSLLSFHLVFVITLVFILVFTLFFLKSHVVDTMTSNKMNRTFPMDNFHLRRTRHKEPM